MLLEFIFILLYLFLEFFILFNYFIFWVFFIVLLTNMKQNTKFIICVFFSFLSRWTVLDLEPNAALSQPHHLPGQPGWSRFRRLRSRWAAGIVLQAMLPGRALDIVQRVGDLQNVTRKHLMVFAMASAGFRYFEAYIRKWNASYIEELSKIFEIWRGNRTTSEFYRFMYEEHGLQCEQVSLFFHFPFVRKREVLALRD